MKMTRAVSRVLFWLAALVVAALIISEVLGCSDASEPTGPSRGSPYVEKDSVRAFLTVPGVYTWHRASLGPDMVLRTDVSRLVYGHKMPPRPYLFVWRGHGTNPFEGVFYAAAQGTVFVEEAGSSDGFMVRSETYLAMKEDVQRWLDEGWSFYYVNAEWDLSYDRAKARFIEDIAQDAAKLSKRKIW